MLSIVLYIVVISTCIEEACIVLDPKILRLHKSNAREESFKFFPLAINRPEAEIRELSNYKYITVVFTWYLISLNSTSDKDKWDQFKDGKLKGGKTMLNVSIMGRHHGDALALMS